MYKIRDRAIGADNKFQIHPTTGVINVTGDLDYETLANPNYQFTVSLELIILLLKAKSLSLLTLSY